MLKNRTYSHIFRESKFTIWSTVIQSESISRNFWEKSYVCVHAKIEWKNGIELSIPIIQGLKSIEIVVSLSNIVWNFLQQVEKYSKMAFAFFSDLFVGFLIDPEK